MRDDGDKEPVSRHAHSHDLESVTGCDELPPKRSTLGERIALFAICGSFFGVLWWLGERLPFSLEVLHIMTACYFAAALFWVFFPTAARMGSPMIAILIYLSIAAPFVLIPFYNHNIPTIVGFIIAGVTSIPIVFFAVGLILRTIKILKGIDVLAEDDRLEAQSWSRGTQRLRKFKAIEQHHNDGADS